MSDASAAAADWPRWRNPPGMPEDLLPYSLWVTTAASCVRRDSWR